MNSSPARELGASCNQPRAALIGDIGPRPLNEDQQTVAETDEKENVNEQPRHPRYEAGNMDLAEFGNGCCAADGGQTAFIPVVERRTVKIPTLSQRARQGWGTRWVVIRKDRGGSVTHAYSRGLVPGD